MRSAVAADADACRRTADLARHLDPEAAERAAAAARALADPVRIALLQVLGGHGGEVCQCDLAPLVPVAQPTLSHHLAKLVDAGLVEVVRRGRWAHYSLADPPPPSPWPAATT